MPTIANTLRREIERSDMTLNALAQAVGVPQPTLWRFVHQAKDRNLEIVEKLLKHFGYAVVKKGVRTGKAKTRPRA